MIEGLGAVEASFQKDTDNPDHRLVQPKTITSPYISEGGILHAIWYNMMLNEKQYQSFTHGLLNLILLVLEAADRAALPQEFNVALAL